MWCVTSVRNDGKWYWAIDEWTQAKDAAQQFPSEFTALVCAMCVFGDVESLD